MWLHFQLRQRDVSVAEPGCSIPTEVCWLFSSLHPKNWHEPRLRAATQNFWSSDCDPLFACFVSKLLLGHSVCSLLSPLSTVTRSSIYNFFFFFLVHSQKCLRSCYGPHTTLLLFFGPTWHGLLHRKSHSLGLGGACGNVNPTKYRRTISHWYLDQWGQEEEGLSFISIHLQFVTSG